MGRYKRDCDIQILLDAETVLVTNHNGDTTVIDRSSIPIVKGKSVSIRDNGYASVGVELLHRKIMNAPRGLQVDHINHDPSDNRLGNLRICTHSQNNANGHGKPRAGKFKGVHWMPRNKKWQATVYRGGEQVFSKRYDSEAEAAMAYDVAAVNAYGEFALTNKMMGLL